MSGSKRIMVPFKPSGDLFESAAGSSEGSLDDEPCDGKRFSTSSSFELGDRSHSLHDLFPTTGPLSGGSENSSTEKYEEARAAKSRARLLQRQARYAKSRSLATIGSLGAPELGPKREDNVASRRAKRLSRAAKLTCSLPERHSETTSAIMLDQNLNQLSPGAFHVDESGTLIQQRFRSSQRFLNTSTEEDLITLDVGEAPSEGPRGDDEIHDAHCETSTSQDGLSTITGFSETQQMSLPVCRKMLRSRLLWIVVICISAAVVGVVVTTRENSDSGSLAGTKAGIEGPPQTISLLSLIQGHSFDNGEALNDPSSPQFRAYAWLQNNTLLSSYNDRRILQRYAIATISYSIPGWTDLGDEWEDSFLLGEDKDECSLNTTRWTCNDARRLKSLSLRRNVGYLYKGTIPPEVALFSDSLVSIDANLLMGRIPTVIGLLAELTTIRFENNEFESIPSEVGQLQNLDHLHLRFNYLKGSIPTEIGSLENLELLDFSSNLINGSVPTEIGQLSNLGELSLHSNMLSGPIPSAIGQLQKVEIIDLRENKLSGSIPSEIGQLLYLDTLWLSENELEGSIPSEIGALENLGGQLRLSENNLEGTLPLEICNMTSLVDLRLNNNKLTGRIPAEIKKMTRLKRLLLHDNKMNGPLPDEINEMDSLRRLLVFNNNFTPPFECENSIRQCRISCPGSTNICRVLQ